MQSRALSFSHYARRIAAKPVLWIGVIGLAGFGLVTATPQAHATTYPGSASACNYSNGTTAPNATGVTGVTPGSTVTISCAAGSFPANSLLVIVEASGLAGIVSPASAQLNEVDLNTLQLPSAAADGSLTDTFTVPNAFAASSDSQATCPPSQAQINVGLTCDLIIASFPALAPQNVAMIVYDGQGTPNAPTLHTTFTIDRGVKTLTESDVPGACTMPVTATSHCWWGAPVTGTSNTAFKVPGLEEQVSHVLAANTLTVSPAVYCQAGATADACSGLAPGTLVPPKLSGTATTSLGLQLVHVDEPNTTPYAGNGTLPAGIAGSLNIEAAQTGPPVRS